MPVRLMNDSDSDDASGDDGDVVDQGCDGIGGDSHDSDDRKPTFRLVSARRSHPREGRMPLRCERGAGLGSPRGDIRVSEPACGPRV